VCECVCLQPRPVIYEAKQRMGRARSVKHLKSVSELVVCVCVCDLLVCVCEVFVLVCVCEVCVCV